MGWLLDLRKIVGHTPLVVPHACTFVINKNREILLQKRMDDNKFDVFGGSVEIDEEVIECAKRELKEETNLAAKTLYMFNIYSGKKERHVYPNGDDISPVDICYLVIEYENELIPQKEEVQSLQFYKEEEISKLDINENIKRRIKDAFIYYDNLSNQK
ncbi:MAG: NUDIX domain-containing protein [Bacilli bacterium]